MLDFVDDKHHYNNKLDSKVSEISIKVMETLVSTWCELSLFVGEELELSKCEWYIID